MGPDFSREFLRALLFGSNLNIIYPPLFASQLGHPILCLFFICVIVCIVLVCAVGTGVCIIGERHVCSTHDG